jgi:hypothetical protein
MELFIPSVLVLLLAAAVVFFILPRFGAPVLALVSVALLVYGIYQHMNAFGNEYRLSTWQLGLVSYAPYVMVGGLLLVMAFYLISLSPLGKPTAPTVNLPEMPSIENMPPASTATNVVTQGVNNALKGIQNTVGNVANVVGLGNGNKKNNTGLGVANTALEAVNQVKNTAVQGVTNAVNAVKNIVTGNTSKNNKGIKIPGVNFPASQI